MGIAIPAGYVTSGQLAAILGITPADVRKFKQTCRFDSNDYIKIGSRSLFKQSAKPKPPTVRNIGLISLTEWSSVNDVPYMAARKLVAEGRLKVEKRDGNFIYLKKEAKVLHWYAKRRFTN